MSLKLLIIADDLTGALDAAAAFAGHTVQVVRRVSALEAASGAEVLALATGTREMTVAEVDAEMQALSAQIQKLPQSRIFKKIDSRAKGHVARELSAIAAMTSIAEAVLCPAIPDMGRFVQNGAVLGAGVANPIALQHIAQACAGVKVTIEDASDQATLDQIVAKSGATMLAGARGLSAALARSMRITARPEGPPPPQGATLFAIGSRDPVTEAQIARLAERGPVLEAPDGLIATDRLCAAISGPAPTILRMTGTGNHPTAGPRFAQTVAGAIRATQATRLFFCGGETANAVLAALQVDHLALLDEPFPGVVRARATVEWGAVDIWTKSGGFGAPELLCQLLDTIEPPVAAVYGEVRHKQGIEPQHG